MTAQAAVASATSVAALTGAGISTDSGIPDFGGPRSWPGRGDHPVRRLRGEDAGFLALELPVQPMNTMALAVLRPGQAADGRTISITLDEVRRHMAARLDELPAFRWRVQPVPFGLNHPVYIDDPAFDLDHHLRQVTVRPPGGPSQLDRLYAGLAERPLDRRHPLWQLIVVNGLAGGRQAVVLRIHHCLMDGFATVNTLARIFTSDAEDQGTGDRVASPWQPEPAPGPARLLADALRDHVRAGRRFPALARLTGRNLAALRSARTASSVSGPTGLPVPVPQPGVDVPASIINRAFSADRRFARISLPIADVKLVTTAAGVRVNDVALALVAGALRAYLEARNALPDRALVANVPVGMEPAGAPPRTFGNRFSSLMTTLATDLDDPWARLQTISAVTAEAKVHLARLGPELLPEWLEFVPPAVAQAAIRHHARRRRRHPERVDVNVVVSNVRGPSRPWSFGPALVEEMYVTGPPNNGVGANIVLWDYGDRLSFGILSFADSVEAPDQLASGLQRALAELVAIAGRHRSVGGIDAV